MRRFLNEAVREPSEAYFRRSKERERVALIRERDQQEKLPPEKRKQLPRPLSNSSINKTIRLLATILEQTVEFASWHNSVMRTRS